MQRDAVPIGWRIETTWGIDPLAGNLPVLGLVRSCKVTVSQNREPQRNVGSSVDPLLFRWKQHQVSVDMGYEVQDDNPTNSFLGMALGDAPNATTGVIVNRPNATNKNLRSFTLELGFDWPNPDEYWRVRGCMVRRLEDSWIDDTLVRKMNILGKIADPPVTTPFMTPPALSSVEVFDAYEDGTVTFSNPTPTADFMASNFRLVIENVLRASGIVKSTSPERAVGFMQIADRNVFAEFEALKTMSDFMTLFFGAPNLAASNIDITATLTKSAAAEYISAALLNCEIVGQAGLEVKQDDEEMRESLRFQAKSFTWDVKST